MNRENKLKAIKEFDAINFYNLNKSLFPEKLVEIFENNYDTFYFMFNVLVSFLADAPEQVKELMMKHYPVFRNEKRPAIKKEIDKIGNVAGVDLIRGIAALMNLKREGITIREHFDPFDRWVKDNSFPEDTWEEVQENERMEFGSPDDEKWEIVKKEENAFRQYEIEWIKKRRFEFIDLLQSILLRYFKGIELFSSDDFIYYSYLLRLEYEDFCDACEEIEYFIDWGLPEEDFTLSFGERMDKQIALGNEKRWAVAELRYRRVYGEEI